MQQNIFSRLNLKKHIWLQMLLRFSNKEIIHFMNFFINLINASPIYKIFCREKQLNKVARRLFEAELFSKHLKDELLQFY